jgi:hypothetical protein
MRSTTAVSSVVILVAVGSAGATAASGISSALDLKATIVLNGQSCDQVVDVKRNADSDYVVSCKDGNRYHVFVDTRGRVVVAKQ